MKRNKECLKLAYDVLKSINWEKYSVHRHYHKNPLLASILAALVGLFFLSGIGHIYIWKLKRAAIILIISTFFRILILICILLIFSDVSIKYYQIKEYSQSEHILGYIYTVNDGFLYIISTPIGKLTLIAASIYFIIYVWHIFDAKRLANEFNRKHNEVMAE